jgi:hypothetical protein
VAVGKADDGTRKIDEEAADDAHSVARLNAGASPAADCAIKGISVHLQPLQGILQRARLKNQCVFVPGTAELREPRI